MIAADSGLRHAAALGVEAEAWLGDFDSSDPALIAANAAVPRIAFPSDKAKTDGELAIDEAILRGATRIILAGAFGGARSDHSLLHSAQALRLAEQGIDCLLTSGAEEAVPLRPGNQSPGYLAGTTFSIIGFEDLSGVTISGARWPLSDAAVPFGSSLTMSNEVTGRLAVSLKSGRAMLFATLAQR